VLLDQSGTFRRFLPLAFCFHANGAASVGAASESASGLLDCRPRLVDGSVAEPRAGRNGEVRNELSMRSDRLEEGAY